MKGYKSKKSLAEQFAEARKVPKEERENFEFEDRKQYEEAISFLQKDGKYQLSSETLKAIKDEKMTVSEAYKKGMLQLEMTKDAKYGQRSSIQKQIEPLGNMRKVVESANQTGITVEAVILNKEVIGMLLFVDIYKEKKEKDFRMAIIPSGINKIGLTQTKDYGIISYLNKEDRKKLGEFVLWALAESDEKVIENKVNVEWGKKFLNCNSYRKVSTLYNSIGFEFFEDKYELKLAMKDGYGYSPFQDMDGKECKHIFHEKPSAEELGKKVMEMFAFKEKYDGGVE